jgi:hypothetical protein
VTRWRIGIALLRFQLQAGARVGLRTLAPMAALAMAAAVLYGSPAVVVAVVRGLLYPPNVSYGAAVMAAVLSTSIAASSAPRLTLGLTGWMRHLPASGVAHRRAATVGLVVVQAPVLAIVLAGGLTAVASQPSTTWPRLLALAPLGWGSALAGLPVDRRWTRLVALAAAATAWSGSWTGLLASTLALALADRHAGRITVRGRRVVGRRTGPQRRQATAIAGGGWSVVTFWMTICRRALGWRLVAAMLAGLMTLMPAMLFLRNNRLTMAQESGVVRLAGIVAALFVMAAVCEGLVKRRPPWPWVRSLPWSSGLRSRLDGLLVVVVSLPVAVLASVLEPRAAFPIIASLPLLALRAAAAVRRAPGRAIGAGGPLLAEGLIVAGLVALVPWFAVGCLLAVPVALRWAAIEERRQDVSGWHELHHLAAGDPLSWGEA